MLDAVLYLIYNFFYIDGNTCFTLKINKVLEDRLMPVNKIFNSL